MDEEDKLRSLCFDFQLRRLIRYCYQKSSEQTSRFFSSDYQSAGSVITADVIKLFKCTPQWAAIYINHCFPTWRRPRRLEGTRETFNETSTRRNNWVKKYRSHAKRVERDDDKSMHSRWYIAGSQLQVESDCNRWIIFILRAITQRNEKCSRKLNLWKAH